MLTLAVLPSLPTVPSRVGAPYPRLVKKEALERFTPPQHLFTSGAAGRFNSRTVLALYCSENGATAGAEFDRYRKPGDAPVKHVLYFVEISAPLLDLTDPANLDKLQVKSQDMFAPWILGGPTVTQRIGDAVARQRRIAGIRFQSDAAREQRFVGYNVVVFKDAVAAPSSVLVMEDDGRVINRWPD